MAEFKIQSEVKSVQISVLAFCFWFYSNWE